MNIGNALAECHDMPNVILCNCQVHCLLHFPTLMGALCHLDGIHENDDAKDGEVDGMDGRYGIENSTIQCELLWQLSKLLQGLHPQS